MGRGTVSKGGVTYGSGRMFRLLVSLLRHTSLGFAYGLADYLGVPIAMMVSPGARLTYRYYHEVHGMARMKAISATYRNHRAFAHTVIDKFAVYAGRTFRMTLHGAEEYEALLSKTTPLLQLSAHIGCSEVLGYSYKVRKPCNILAYGGEKEELMSYREASFEGMNMRMIPVGTGSENGEEILGALDRGEVLCTFADRYSNPERVITSTMFGHEVSLARGPFQLAVTRGLDVIMVSAMKERDGSYSAFFTPLAYDRSQAPKKQRQQLADAYAHEAERLLRMYPEQWFDYFKLWNDDTIDYKHKNKT